MQLPLRQATRWSREGPLVIARRCLAALLIPTATMLASRATAAQVDGVASNIAARPVTRARPVPGADERIHIPYELQVVNQPTALITVERVEVLAADGTRPDELSGEALGRKLRIGGGETGRTFGPSHSGYLFMDVCCPKWPQHRRSSSTRSLSHGICAPGRARTTSARRSAVHVGRRSTAAAIR